MPTISLSLNRAAWEAIMDEIPKGKRSAFVSQAIINHMNERHEAQEKWLEERRHLRRAGVKE